MSFDLVPSTPAIAACLPNAKANVSVDIESEKKGFDTFTIQAQGLPANEGSTESVRPRSQL